MVYSDAELTSIIKKVWEEVLLKENITNQDQFSELGGDASKVVEIVFYLEEKLQMELPVEVMIMMATIEEMAFAIKALKKEKILKSDYLTAQQIIKLQMNMASLGNLVKEDSLMVKINEDGNLPPLFWCFNVPGQEVLALSKHLSSNQPLYALVSSVSLGKAEETLENIAAHYVDEIIKLYPEGPYYLGGNCRGAKVMCEVVFQLQARGKHVDGLCLLEFFHPQLYDFTGKFVLMFGEMSEFERHKLLNWGEEGWQDKFKKAPEVFFIPCAHGQFFLDKNIKHLVKGIHHYLGKKTGLLSFLFQK